MATVITVPATPIVADVEKHGVVRTVPGNLTGVNVQLNDTNGMWGPRVTGVTNANNPTITTSIPHGLSPGDTVTIRGVLGAGGVDGTFTVTSVPSSTTFKLTTAAPGAYTSGGGIVIPNTARTAAGLPVGNIKQWGIQCSKDGGASWSWGPVFQGDPNDSTTWLAFGLLGRNGLPPGLTIGSDIVNNTGDQLRLGILTDADITLGATITTSP